MPLPEEVSYADRHRAESFGAVAEAYDAYRPSYPAALIDDLVALGPSDVLDVGCGTGKAARLLAERGLAVLGVEQDPQMAAIARRHGLRVEVGPFEAWADGGRRFDLITCAQAWHWIDPAAGAARAAEVLRPGGTLALFWNFAAFDAASERALDDAYEGVVPELSQRGVVGGRGAGTLPAHEARLLASGFVAERRTYAWQRSYGRDEWLAVLGTYSDHSTLPPERLGALLRAVAAAVDGLGGALRADYTTYALLARVSP